MTGFVRPCPSQLVVLQQLDDLRDESLPLALKILGLVELACTCTQVLPSISALANPKPQTCLAKNSFVLHVNHFSHVVFLYLFDCLFVLSKAPDDVNMMVIWVSSTFWHSQSPMSGLAGCQSGLTLSA